ncbi:outer membrane protein assembly factor [Subsaxibacter sp. CAU 1640]|uniref:outer membrane protein assembly factor n=1 Tax=Subsaxibacter sp. CAU 1640 TaxID=2933271 RepID=UPI002006BA4A|nr:outer membrane protein assembly factor [Subsaxibacter sp. CAU 1640]MCK7591948.1 outer membrane protein assembly factor [Subsaxibacter sp. CAU 1640]
MLLKRIMLFAFLGLTSFLKSQSQTLYLKAQGADEKQTQTIDSLYYKKSFSDFSSLNEEIQLIKKRLINIGYIETDIAEVNKLNDSSYLAQFDLKQLYKKIRLNLNGHVDKNVLRLLQIDTNRNYLEIEVAELESTLEKLNSEISNQVDPFSSLQLTNIKKLADGSLLADVSISEKKAARTIDSIIVKGYEKFPKAFVIRYLKIRRKQPFNLKTIKDKTSDLENLQFSNQIKEPEVLFTKDSTLLYIYIEKQRSNSFDGFLGFGTNTETNKIEFNGYLNLNLINNLNYGESLRLIYKSDENEQKTFDLKANLPYLFGSPLGTEFGLNIFKRDSSFVTVFQSAKVQYQINPRNLISVGIDATTSTSLLDNSTNFVQDYKSVFYNTNYQYTKRQKYDKLFPINLQLDISFGFGKRTVADLNEDQTKFGLDTYKIFNLNNKNSIYMRLAGAIINSDSYFENELYRFGGINSIRGFEENSLAANLFSVLNTEYRYRVNNSLYVHSILDASYFENQTFDVKEKLFGFGFGFGLINKAGLFRFNYSNGKTQNQSFKLSDSKIHLSLTATF